MRSWILSLAHCYAPSKVGMVIVDFQQRLFKYGGSRTLADLPQVLAAISDPAQLPEVIEKLQMEFAETRPDSDRRPELFVVADNYDDFANVVGSPTSTKSTFYKDAAELARKFGPEGLQFVLCGSLNVLRSPDDLMKHVLSLRYGLGLDANDAPTALGGRVRSGSAQVEFPPGRGYVVRSGRVSLIQVAIPQNETDVEGSLDAWVNQIIDRFPERYVWYKDTLPEPEPEPEPEAATPETVSK
jgi:hypothetical protein